MSHLPTRPAATSGLCITFRHLKESVIWLRTGNLIHSQNATFGAWVAMFDHYVDTEILRVPILVCNNHLFRAILRRQPCLGQEVGGSRGWLHKRAFRPTNRTGENAP